MADRLDLASAAERLAEAVRQQQTFAFVRVGDGEAMLLDPMANSARYPNLGPYHSVTANRLKYAVLAADLVGVQQRRDGEFERIEDVAALVRHEQCDADIWYRLEPAAIAELLNPSSFRTIPWHIVTRRRDIPASVMNLCGIDGVITCPDTHAAHHYSEVMKLVRSTMEERGVRGVLCAAGPLGTIMPPRIVEEFGVPSFDIGGLADVWAMHKTRSIIGELGLIEKWREFLGAHDQDRADSIPSVS
ncbi:MAG: hypothetical protein ACE5FA_07105 [Dehalococcoidia bacterium]